MRRVSEHFSATHPFYACWYNIHQRCYNEHHVAYKDYGARGIFVAERWHTFENFYQDMFPAWKRGLEIERRDNSGPYAVENCCWATRSQNCRNTRATKLNVEQVVEIRRRYGSVSNVQLGKEFGVNASHVCRIANREKWVE